MSIKIMSMVWDIAPTYLTSSEKLLLLRLADFCADDGSRIYPSLKRLEHDTALSRRWIIKALQSLQIKNVLIKEQEADKAKHLSCVYRIDIKVLKNWANKDTTLVNSVHQGKGGASELSAPGASELSAPQPLLNNHYKNTYIGDSENQITEQPKQPKEKQTFFDEELIPITEAQEIALDAGIHESWIESQWNDFKLYWSDRRDKKAKKTLRGWKQTWRNNCLGAPHRVSKPKPTSGNNMSNSTFKNDEDAVWIYDDMANRNVKITSTGYDKGEDQYGYKWGYISRKWWRCGHKDETDIK